MLRMSRENVLLLFSKGYPCWNEELVELAGENPTFLQDLQQKGLLVKEKGICSLTQAGRKAFTELAREYYYDATPADPAEDHGKELLKCRLSLMLNRSFVGRWGVKNFHVGQPLTYYPGLKKGDICSISPSKKPRWIYNEMAIINEIRETFPQNRQTDRHPSILEIKGWMEERGMEEGSLEIDVLFLHYCDFVHYMHKVPPASDTLKLLHADRFYMNFVRKEFYDDPLLLFEEIGKFHLFLLYYRHLILPGNFDIDIHEQGNLNALMYITETEEEAIRFYETFSPLAEELTGPADPMDIWSMSMEAIENHPMKEDSHFDFFAKIGHRVAITYPPGG